MQPPNSPESEPERAARAALFCEGIFLDRIPEQKNPTEAMSSEAPGIPKPPAKTFEWVAPGIYRYLKAGTLYERPWVNGRRTLRSLGTADLQAAQRELRRRRGLPIESGCGRPIFKAILEFNLPEAQERFEASAKSLEWKSVVVELDRQLDSWMKERQHFATPAKALRILRQQLHQRLVEKGLRLGSVADERAVPEKRR